MRWVIIALFFGATILNQIDRQTLSILARTIQDDLRMTDLDYAYVVQAFLVFYAIGMFATGRIADRVGTKVAAISFLAFWSCAQMATGLVNSVLSLGAARGALALGEAGNYTAAPRAVAEWFPAKERGLAVGIYTSAGMLGAVIAPPLIGYSALSFGWRTTFIWTGALGLVWCLAFAAFYKKPPAPATLHDEESVKADQSASSVPFRRLIRHPAVWRLFLARMLTDPVWYFYLFWFPKYLQDSRDFTLQDVASIAWVVYLAADLGSILGGIASGRLIRRGWEPAAARVRVLLFVAALIPSGLLLSQELPIVATLVIASFVAFLHLVWLTNLTAAMVDIFPLRQLGSAVGVVGAGSAIGGAISSPIIGYLITYYSYEAVFVMLGCLHPIGWLCLSGIARGRHSSRQSVST